MSDRPTNDIVSDLRLQSVDEMLRLHGFVAVRQFLADAAERLEDQADEIDRLLAAPAEGEQP